jgi:hypothetical protein
MKNTFGLLAISAVLCTFSMSADSQKTPPRSNPAVDGYVPDASTAEKIALAVMIPVFGPEAVAFQKPYTVRLSKGEKWVVQGNWPPPGDSSINGGTLIVHISKKDGKIVELYRSK